LDLSEAIWGRPHLCNVCVKWFRIKRGDSARNAPRLKGTIVRWFPAESGIR
jgi:hypothetical protein